MKESRGPVERTPSQHHRTAPTQRLVSTKCAVRIVVGGLCRFLACQHRLMFFLLIIKTTSYCLHHVGTSTVRCNYLRHGCCWPPQLPISLGFTLHSKKCPVLHPQEWGHCKMWCWYAAYLACSAACRVQWGNQCSVRPWLQVIRCYQMFANHQPSLTNITTKIFPAQLLFTCC